MGGGGCFQVCPQPVEVQAEESCCFRRFPLNILQLSASVPVRVLGRELLF